MPVVVELPRLSDTMEEGVVAKWLIKEGDKVKRGQVIAEIETDKATMEFESFDAGTVLKLVAGEGETLALGSPIAVLGKAGEDPASALASATSAASATPAPAEEAAPVAASENAGPATAPAPEVTSPAPAAVSVSDDERRIPASPVARLIAREAGIDLRVVSGSGPHGRIVKADVEGHANSASTSTPAASLSGDKDEYGRPYATRGDVVQPISQMRKAIVRSMTASKFSAPHFYLTMDVEMDAAAKFRSECNMSITGTKISFNDLVVAAAARALRSHARVNSAYTEQGIVEHGDINIGVAVAIDDGLVVPVVRHAEQKTLTAISQEIRSLGKRAKNKELRPAEMQGGTFTVSNLGMFGIDEFTAVINPGEGAIMAIGAVREELALDDDGNVTRCRRMKVTLSSDHRVIDGAVGARFLGTFRDNLEHPMRMFA